MAEYTVDKIEYDGNVYKLQDNISGYSTTDEKLKINAIDAGTTYYFILHSKTGSTAASTKFYDNGGGIAYKVTSGAPSIGELAVGTPDSSGTSSKRRGSIKIYGTNTKGTILRSDNSSTNSDDTILFPHKDGTVALISDIPSIATNSTAGIVKPWYYHSVASTGPTAGSNSTAITVNAITTTSGKYYAVESDVNGRLFVNVPWSGGTYQSGTSALIEAGSNTTDSVWTPKILHDYIQSAVGSIGYVSKTENTYTTGSSSVSTIPIGISEYTSTDLLLVDINGLDLIQGTDYTVSGTNIVLATPITTSGTKVHFVDFKLVTATVSDIATLKGDAAGFGTVNATVDSGTGTPSVTVTTSGPDTAKNMSFEFHNLKGTDGTHTISYTPIVTGGAQIGTITIDNTNYPLYAPAVVWG